VSVAEPFSADGPAGPVFLEQEDELAHSSGDLLEGASRFFDRMLEGDQIYFKGLIFETLAEASRNPEIRNMLGQVYENSVDTLSEFLGDLKSKKIVRADVDVRLLARGLIAIYDGFIASLVRDPDKTEAKKAWNTLIKAILFG